MNDDLTEALNGAMPDVIGRFESLPGDLIIILSIVTGDGRVRVATFPYTTPDECASLLRAQAGAITALGGAGSTRH